MSLGLLSLKVTASFKDLEHRGTVSSGPSHPERAAVNVLRVMQFRAGSMVWQQR